jgi:hypothetical protein
MAGRRGVSCAGERPAEAIPQRDAHVRRPGGWRRNETSLRDPNATGVERRVVPEVVGAAFEAGHAAA